MANTRKRIGALILAIVMAFSVIIPTVAVEIASDSHPFTDVREGAWYHGYVLFVSNANLKNGTGATTFSPHLATSRAMVATVLYRMAGSPGTEGITNPFDDVALGTWYTDAVIWAADNGIVNGVGSGRFAPHLDITRQDLAAMMARYAAFEGFELSAQRTYTGFADSGDIAVHAYTAVQALFEAGVINGHPDNRFAPLANALRAEFAAMLTRFVTNAGFSAFLNGESSQDGAVEGSPEQRDDASAGWQAGNQNGGPGGGSGGGQGGNQGGGNQNGGQDSTPGTANEFSIIGISVDSTEHTVFVELIAGAEAYVVVSIYEDNVGSGSENTNKLAGGEAEIFKTEGSAAFEVGLDRALPTHFVVVAQIVDGSGNSLSDPFTYIGYTQAFEEFLATTIYDFDLERVINFDDDPTNNFIVASDGVLLIRADTGDMNSLTVSSDETVFTFTDADDTVLSLEVGQRIIIDSYASSTFYLVEITAIGADSQGAVTIVSNADLEMTNFLDFIKIDLQISIGGYAPHSPASFMAADAHESYALTPFAPAVDFNFSDRVYLEIRSEGGQILPIILGIYGIGIGAGLNYDFEAILGLGLGVSVVAHYAPALFGSHAHFDIRVEYCIDFEGYFNIAIPLHLQVNVHTVLINLVADTSTVATAGLSQFVRALHYITPIGLYLHVHAETPVTGYVSFERAGVVGCIFTYHRNILLPRVDFQKINIVHPVRNCTVGVEAGAALSVAVELIMGVLPIRMSSTLFAGLEVYVGMQFRAYASHRIPFDMSRLTRHECYLCLRIEIYGIHEVFVGGRYNIFFSSGEFALVRLGDRNTPGLLFTTFASILNRSNSVHGGFPAIGLGQCPNFSLRTTVIPRDIHGNIVTSALPEIYRHTGEYVRTGIGQAFFWLFPGEFLIRVSDHNHRFTDMPFIVTDQAQTIDVFALPNQDFLEIRAIDAKTYGDAPFALSVEGGTAEGTVTYSIVSGSGVISIDGNIVTIHSAGTAVVVATNDGGNTHNSISSEPVTITVSPRAITFAGVTIDAPVAGRAPSATSNTLTNSPLFSASPAFWLEDGIAFTGSEFTAGSAYTAVVTLTAVANHTFDAVPPEAVSINGQRAEILSNNGVELVLQHHFGVISAAHPVEIDVIAQPAQISFTHGDLLNLDGLIVMVAFDNGEVREGSLESFGGLITTSPAVNSPLLREIHNWQPVTISMGDLSTETIPLIIDRFDLSSAELSGLPAYVTFTGSPQEPLPTVRWRGGEVPSDDYYVYWSNNIDAGTATLTVAARADSVNFSGVAVTTFTINRAVGADVIGHPARLPGASDTTIEVRALTSSTNQPVEYALSENRNAPADSLQWQEGTVFSGLTPGSAYFIFARSAQYNNHLAGAPVVSNMSVLAGISITNQAQLSAIRNQNGYFVLENDIYLYGAWTPVTGFTGTLDGNGFTIHNLHIPHYAYVAHAGLFGDVTQTLTIKNLGVNISEPRDTLTLGSGIRLIGLAANTAGASGQESAYAGGLIARIGSGTGSVTLSNVFVNGNIAAYITRNSGGPARAHAGGLIGFIAENAIPVIIENSFASGEAGAVARRGGGDLSRLRVAGAGGLVGWFYGNSQLSISTSYALNEVRAESFCDSLASSNISRWNNTGRYADALVATRTPDGITFTQTVHPNSQLVRAYAAHRSWGARTATHTHESSLSFARPNLGETLVSDTTLRNLQNQPFTGLWDFVNVWEIVSYLNNGFPVLRGFQR